jgi:hypothetical protein
LTGETGITTFTSYYDTREGKGAPVKRLAYVLVLLTAHLYVTAPAHPASAATSGMHCVQLGGNQGAWWGYCTVSTLTGATVPKCDTANTLGFGQGPATLGVTVTKTFSKTVTGTGSIDIGVVKLSLSISGSWTSSTATNYSINVPSGRWGYIYPAYQSAPFTWTKYNATSTRAGGLKLGSVVSSGTGNTKEYGAGYCNRIV